MKDIIMRDGFLKYKDKNKKSADKTLESDKERAKFHDLRSIY